MLKLQIFHDRIIDRAGFSPCILGGRTYPSNHPSRQIAQENTCILNMLVDQFESLRARHLGILHDVVADQRVSAASGGR